MVTHAVRFCPPQGQKPNTKAKNINAYFVNEDIKYCDPDVIIALGADAYKSIYGKDAKLDSSRGDVLTFNNSKVIPTSSPWAFVSSHADIQVFRSELRRACEVGDGVFLQAKPDKKNYITITSTEMLTNLVNELLVNPPRRIAFDTEFGNDNSREEDRYTQTVQFCWTRDKVCLVPFRNVVPQPPKYVRKEKTLKSGKLKVTEKLIEMPPKGGNRLWSEDDEQILWSELHRLFSHKDIQLCAHNLRVDIEEFNRAGFNLDDKIPTGFCTMLVHHLLYGDESQGLDHLVRKYAPRYGAYWKGVEDFLSSNGRSSTLRFGYRDIPDDVLFPYAFYDAAAAFEVAEELEKELISQPRLHEFYYNHVSWTSLHLLDVERNGILVDETRRAEIRELYKPVHQRLLAKLRKLINWPDFNPASKEELAYLLFNQYEYKDRDKLKDKVPRNANLLSYRPLFNTDKYPKFWDRVIEDGEESRTLPSTKSATIDLLLNDNPDDDVLHCLKHCSVVGKMLNSYLAEQTINEFGVPEDGSAFQDNIYRDGRVRTHLSQLTQTGRYTSKKANLQTSPKKQEDAALAAFVYDRYEISLKEYRKKLKSGEVEEIHIPKFKSCMIAADGYVLVEADFKTAELFVWAYCSGDPVLKAVLDNGRDLHSETAAKSFQLPELAELLDILNEIKDGKVNQRYKDWNDNFKKKQEALRTAAKSVVFGVMYGRGANALAREISKTGVPTTKEQCEQVIDGIAKAYPVAWQWIKDNQDSAVENAYVENPFGRKRYFSGIQLMSDSDKAAARREASNSPIQSAVADLLAAAGYNLYKFKRSKFGNRIDFKILLPIHDAFLFEVKKEDLDNFKKVLELCMSTKNFIPGTQNYLKVDIEVMSRWGEKH
jgi:DNA polymerase-1